MNDPADEVQMVRLPVSKQIESKRTEFLSTLADLQAEFLAATDSDSAMELQRKISAHKLNYEIGLHRLQLDYAMKSADTERVEEIRATIVALEKRLPKIESPELKEAGK